MMCFGRDWGPSGTMFVGMILICIAAVAVVVVAGVTSWWIVPVVMMTGCIAMMAGSRSSR